MSYQFHSAAQEEHLAHVGHYEAIQIGLGARYLADFEATAEHICEAPHRFRLEPHPTYEWSRY